MFARMCEIVPEGRQGEAMVDHFEIDRSLFRGPPPGKYARLRVGGALMMSDTPDERRSNSVIWRARGDVLIGGLGLGMVAHHALLNPNVQSVTVIEKSADVIALVEPHIRRHVDYRSDVLKVINDDVFTWEKTGSFDFIYFDIWGDVSTDDLEEMTRLRRRYTGKVRKPGCAVHCWQEHFLKREKVRSSANAWARW